MLLIATTIVCRRSKLVVIAFLGACGAYLLSLGSPLLIDNSYVGWVHLPGAVLRHLPLLEGAAAARFSLFVSLFAALLLGVALERLHAGGLGGAAGGSLSGTPTALVAGGALFPLVPALPYAETTVDTPAFFTTSAVDLGARRLGVAIVYPQTTPIDADSTLWQASSGMRFRMPGAYALVPAAGAAGSQWGTPTLTSGTLGSIVGGGTIPETATLAPCAAGAMAGLERPDVPHGPRPERGVRSTIRIVGDRPRTRAAAGCLRLVRAQTRPGGVVASDPFRAARTPCHPRKLRPPGDAPGCTKTVRVRTGHPRAPSLCRLVMRARSDGGGPGRFLSIMKLDGEPRAAGATDPAPADR